MCSLGTKREIVNGVRGTEAKFVEFLVVEVIFYTIELGLLSVFNYFMKMRLDQRWPRYLTLLGLYSMAQHIQRLICGLG
jgi:hypothetical protein